VILRKCLYNPTKTKQELVT